MSEIEIVGAKLVGGLFCHYKFREDIGKGRHDTVTIKSERPIHEDLVAAFQALTIHMPVILQDVQPGDVEDINSDVSNYLGSDKFKEIIENFTVTEVNREIEEGRAQLIGTKSLDLGVMQIETPMIRYEGNYYYKLEFQFHIDRLMDEVAKYRQGKQAPEMVQPELFSTTDEEEPKEKKKRGRPKKAVEIFADLANDLLQEGLTMTVSNSKPGEQDEFNQPQSAFQRDPADVED